jgi:hypothetical protein
MVGNRRTLLVWMITILHDDSLAPRFTEAMRTSAFCDSARTLTVFQNEPIPLRLRGGRDTNLLDCLSPSLMNATRLPEKQFSKIARTIWREFGSQNGSALENERLQSFRAGRMIIEGRTLRPLAEKGMLVFEISDDDGMIHMLWMERNNNAAERRATVDLILVPGES